VRGFDLKVGCAPSPDALRRAPTSPCWGEVKDGEKAQSII
jgi:hypothetical protein